MRFAAPQHFWSLLAFVPLLVLLNYLTHRRLRAEVPSLILWRRLLERFSPPRSTRRRLFSWALLLQIAAVGALVAAAAAPERLLVREAPLRVAVYRNASTAARRDGKPLLELMLERLRASWPRAEVTFLPPGGTGPSHLPAPPAPVAGFDLVVTDRPRSTPLPQLVVPARDANLAIVHLAGRAEAGRLKVVAHVLSTRDEPTDASLAVRVGGTDALTIPMRIEPGTNVARFELDEPGEGVVEVRLKGVADALLLDDVAYLRRSARRGAVRVAGGPPESVTRALWAAGFDVIATDESGGEATVWWRGTPETPPLDGTMLLFAPRTGLKGFFSVDAARPPARVRVGRLFRDPNAFDGLDFQDSVCFRPAPGAEAVVHAADADGRPVVLEVVRGRARVLAVGLDPRSSGWEKRASFVVFVAEALRTGDSGWTAPRVGAATTIKAGDDAVAIAPSGGRTRPAVVGGAAELVPDEVGLWRIATDGRNVTVGVGLLDAEESRIRADWKEVSPRLKTRKEESRRPLHVPLILIGLVLLAAGFAAQRR